MAHFMVQVCFTADAAGALIQNVPDREAIAREVVESLGGRVHSYFYAFGPTDAFVHAEFPSNIEAAALSMAVASSGAFSKFETTPLLTNAEAMEAMRKAQGIAYRSPLQS